VGKLKTLARLTSISLLLVGMVTGIAAGQVTSGTLSGTVVDAQGGVLPGVTLEAVHQPTGTIFTGVTEADGRFVLPNVRVGGPYSVKASLAGFRDQLQENVTVTLGEERALDFTLQLETVTETVQVVAKQSEVFNPSAQGTASNVSQQQLELLPTIARRIDDFARTNPFFQQTAVGAEGSALSVAGRNNRYNNIQVDGAVNNDLFGLAASGVPGGQADAQPVSLDAIQELQLIVSPYDVRQGGFSGGGINAVTKSGSNDFSGTGYWFGRSEGLVGKGPSDRRVSEFSQNQFGGSLGGPVVRNRAFFFTNLDYNRRKTPTGWSADGQAAQDFGRRDEVDRFLSIIRNKYGYDPGPTSEFSRRTEDNKFFVRGDVNVAAGHQLIARHNYIDAITDIGTPSGSTWLFPDGFYQFNSSVNSTVVQLNSNFGRGVNELRVTFQRIRDRRGGSDEFPGVFPKVMVDVSSNGSIQAGREQFSTANELDQDVIELTDDFTMVRGKHTFTFGTHNEFFQFRNLFIRDNFGTYRFASLDLFDQGLAQQFDYSFSLTPNPQQAAEFSVNQLGFYAGDQWRVAPRFTLTYGARIDIPVFGDPPTRNPQTEELFGLRTDITPEGVQFSPRVGFNWDLGTEARQQVRGGVGLFSGRTPYVWLSNQYGNTGIEFRRLNVPFGTGSARIPFVADVTGQPTTVGNAATNEIDLLDPDYTYPYLVRGNLAYDRDLFGGLIASVEFLFSEVVQDIAYQNLNIEQIGTRPTDGRPLFRRIPNGLSDVIFLTNAEEGNAYNVAFKVEKPFRSGWYASGSYAYGKAESINDGTSSQAASNWGFLYVPGDPNNPPLATSNYEARHRINLAGTYRFDLKAVGVTASMFYNGQNGRPWSASFNGDANTDTRTSNDQLYIPASADEVIFRNGTYEDLIGYVNSVGLGDFIGQIVPRNADYSPWFHGVDFRLLFDVPFGGRRRLEFSFDVFNFFNLFDQNTGTVQFLTNQQRLPVQFAGIDTATGKMIYNVQTITAAGFTPFFIDDLRSRWQGQFGVRVRF
jgi:Carboxypeptidase regulatory-like domain/TonB-dependent Receptor Plug Domain